MSPPEEKDRNRVSRPKRHLSNPLQAGIRNFVDKSNLASHEADSATETGALPKRYTLYPPLLLLPANFITHKRQWKLIYSSLSDSERQDLFASIAHAFRAQGVTHIAINAPISVENEWTGSPNVTRSPTGLVPVYGDSGPTTLGYDQPTEEDFAKAFWVSTVQNGGIVQVWAPLWTMFSRGNIKEKARILGGQGVFSGSTGERLHLGEVDVLDLYVGIGYFAFSYLKRGARRVWGWEINGWSVEGLRRGAERNGWVVAIVRVDELGDVDEGALNSVLKKVSSPGGGAANCVVFQGDNRWAGKVTSKIKDRLEQAGKSEMLKIRHANLGLLPDSRGSWENAISCLDQQRGGWLHVHENVDIKQTEDRATAISVEIQELVKAQGLSALEVSCAHIEHVKTYAPGVMHCVFDIEILPAR